VRCDQTSTEGSRIRSGGKEQVELVSRFNSAHGPLFCGRIEICSQRTERVHFSRCDVSLIPAKRVKFALSVKNEFFQVCIEPILRKTSKISSKRKDKVFCFFLVEPIHCRTSKISSGRKESFFFG